MVSVRCSPAAAATMFRRIGCASPARWSTRPACSWMLSSSSPAPSCQRPPAERSSAAPCAVFTANPLPIPIPFRSPNRRPSMLELICDVLHENARNGILPAHIGDIAPTPQMSLSDLGTDSLGKLTVLSELCGRLRIPPLDHHLHASPRRHGPAIGGGTAMTKPPPVQPSPRLVGTRSAIFFILLAGPFISLVLLWCIFPRPT